MFGLPFPKAKSQILCTFTANLKSSNLGRYFNYCFPQTKYSESTLYSYCMWVLLEAPSNNFREMWHRSKLYKWNSLSLIHFSCFFQAICNYAQASVTLWFSFWDSAGTIFFLLRNPCHLSRKMPPFQAKLSEKYPLLSLSSVFAFPGQKVLYIKMIKKQTVAISSCLYYFNEHLQSLYDLFSG